jgi:predicted transcriptional regulator
MPGTETLTVALPPAMIERFEKVRRAENRTKSGLVLKALQMYLAFAGRFPEVEPSKLELAAIRRGRAAFARGEQVTFGELEQELAARRSQTRAKKPAKASLKRQRPH